VRTIGTPMDEQRQIIGLLDHMGFGNLGDAATQEVVIDNIKARVPNAGFVGFSLVPDDTNKRHGILCYPIRRSCPALEMLENKAVCDIDLKPRPKSLQTHNRFIFRWTRPIVDITREVYFLLRSYRILQKLDVLIISGGGQLDELWPGQPYTVFKFSVLAKLARKKLVLLNVGVGILNRPLNRVFARWTLRLANYRSVRDQESKERLRNLGVKEEVYVYPDLVYALRIKDKSRLVTDVRGKQVVGLNPLSFCDPRLWPRKDSGIYQKYLQKITRFSEWLLQQGYDLRLFSTDFSVDRYAIEDLRVAVGETLSTPELIYETCRGTSDSVKNTLREMAAFDYVVTSKYHGLVFSHLLGKPVISLSYQSKMDALMRAVGQERFATNVEYFEVDWLIKAFRSLVEERQSIEAGSLAAVEVNAAALSEQLNGLFPARGASPSGFVHPPHADRSTPFPLLEAGALQPGLISEKG
jgi:polysaccharide pyruvyl transferase WcaK-like protein